jgi:hypothetical protein
MSADGDDDVCNDDDDYDDNDYDGDDSDNDDDDDDDDNDVVDDDNVDNNDDDDGNDDYDNDKDDNNDDISNHNDEFFIYRFILKIHLRKWVTYTSHARFVHRFLHTYSYYSQKLPLDGPFSYLFTISYKNIKLYTS